MDMRKAKNSRKTKLECQVPPKMKDEIDEIAASNGLRRGPCMRELCKAAVRDPDHVSVDFDAANGSEKAQVSVYVNNDWLEHDATRAYRGRHRLVTNRDFFVDALKRGIAIFRGK